MYVVDSGFSKQRFYNPVTNLLFECLNLCCCTCMISSHTRIISLMFHLAKLFLVNISILPTPLVSMIECCIFFSQPIPGSYKGVLQ